MTMKQKPTKGRGVETLFVDGWAWFHGKVPTKKELGYFYPTKAKAMRGSASCDNIVPVTIIYHLPPNPHKKV